MTVLQGACRRLAAIVAVASLLIASGLSSRVPSQNVAAKAPRLCAHLAVSPNFATDGSAVCATLLRDQEEKTMVRAQLYATSDKGRSWQPKDGLGIIVEPYDRIMGIHFSPQYSTDQTVFLTMLQHGVFVSEDLGDSFEPVLPVFNGDKVSAPGTSAFGGLVPAERVVLAQAITGSDEGSNKSVLIDPSTRARIPIKGTPGFDTTFLFGPTGKAYAISEFGLGSGRHYELFECNAVFDCSTKLAQFPQGSIFDRLWFAPNFAQSKTMFVSLRRALTYPQLLKSSNGGETWKPWKPVQRLLDATTRRAATGNDAGYGLTGVPGTSTLFFRITAFVDDIEAKRRKNLPGDRLWRSADLGKTWKLVSYGRRRGAKGSKGTMPEPQEPFSASSGVPPSILWAASKKHLFAIGGQLDRGEGISPGLISDVSLLNVLYCSTDSGKTWARTCR